MGARHRGAEVHHARAAASGLQPPRRNNATYRAERSAVDEVRLIAKLQPVALFWAVAPERRAGAALQTARHSRGCSEDAVVSSSKSAGAIRSRPGGGQRSSSGWEASAMSPVTAGA